MLLKKPPFSITPLILGLCQKIAHELGLLEGYKLDLAPIQLRKETQIKIIQSSLAIEGNSLTLEQVTDLLEGRRVKGPEREILEVKNAIAVYHQLNLWDPLSVLALKEAHHLLMKDLVPHHGEWREKGVGIFKGKDLAHMAPPAHRVPELMENLFYFMNHSDDLSWIIKGCIFHYELEFIHPFSDGNGRMGRLWQQLIFMKDNPLFQFISIESLIKRNQMQYYHSLAASDKAGDSTFFIEFSLEQTLLALQEYGQAHKSKAMDASMRLNYAKEKLYQDWFSRKDYLVIHPKISTATASRDLEKGLQLGMLVIKGAKNTVKYRFTLFEK